MRLQGRHYFSLFWVLFFAGFIYVSFGYTYKARLIPLVVCLPCLAFALYRFYVELTGKEDGVVAEKDERLKEIMEKVGEISLGKAAREKLDQAEKMRRFRDILLWMAIFLVLIFAAGFLVAIPIFTLAYMRMKEESWLLSTLCSIGLTLGVYAAFVIGTESYLYEGLLLPQMRLWLQS
jgi:hypothetical protein